MSGSSELKSRHSGQEVSETRRLRGLDEKNTKLTHLMAEAVLDNAGPMDLLEKAGDVRREAVAQLRASIG